MFHLCCKLAGCKTSPAQKPYEVYQQSSKPFREAELSAWALLHTNVAMWLPGLALGESQAAWSAGRASHRSACTHPRRHVLRKQCWEDSSVFKRKKTQTHTSVTSPERRLILLLSHSFLHLPHAPQVLHQQEVSQERNKKIRQFMHLWAPSASSCLWDRTLQKRLVWQMGDRAASTPAPRRQTQHHPASSPGELVCIQTYQTQFG